MRINNNIMAYNAHRQLKVNASSQEKSLEKLSSGYRINRAGDDAAGLSISEKMRAQIRGLTMASKNAQDGISLIQTAEGALTETHSILQRMRELAVQAANDTNVTKDRSAIKLELNELAAEITRIGEKTQFNTQNLLTGSLSGKLLQIGANKGETLSITVKDMRATALGVKASALSVASSGSAQNTIALVNSAISKVSEERAKLGAKQNRLEHTIKNLDTAAENLQASESRIRDVDMAQEMMNFTKNNILNQAATAMLAQANQVPQGVLQLLG
ncbi:flagellin N-terminal helical domain-containing protein [Acetivibrio mesophilus]|uniref:Flagellin n=1 Tax=Acetivibrio mesophilus TaxID=2487273 RepID=A0A4Q0I3I8_9FIRM|nr:flagellin [Acetivibrio mesophilus]ODM27329.1 flagellin [Clostridium sp. Bc-iso-3]RXE58834.1 flagellin [Acetivibrio mesophilus]HHV28932.1 flagellin [Clostridium sp.]